MNAQNPPQDFLDSLAAQDFAGLAATLAPYAAARLLLPSRTAELAGAAAIRDQFQTWFGRATDLTVLAGGAEPVGARWRLQYRFRLRRDGGPAEVIEQVAFAEVGPTGIFRLDLLCSGFHAESPAAGALHVFDAGTLGCADGLAQEFRRRLAGVRVGESLAVVVSDPAAREDLPSLARLLGQAVTSTETRDDGRLEITVEKLR